MTNEPLPFILTFKHDGSQNFSARYDGSGRVAINLDHPLFVTALRDLGPIDGHEFLLVAYAHAVNDYALATAAEHAKRDNLNLAAMLDGERAISDRLGRRLPEFVAQHQHYDKLLEGGDVGEFLAGADEEMDSIEADFAELRRRAEEKEKQEKGET